MTPTRVALLVLLVLVVLFVLVLWSVEGDDPSFSSSKDFNKRFQRPAWTDTAFRLMGPFSPRLELRRKAFQVQAGQTSQPILVTSSDWPFRRAAWVLRSGGKAWVRYRALSTDLEDLKEQELELVQNEPPKSLAIVASGGQITITCSSQTNCLLELVD